MSFTLAIVGRPNVGKSTLFNRLVGKRLALVDDQPGVTRDLREGEARLGDLRFTVIDTAGLEEATDESLQGRMRRLTERAVDMADICLFMIDARAGRRSRSCWSPTSARARTARMAYEPRCVNSNLTGTSFPPTAPPRREPNGTGSACPMHRIRRATSRCRSGRC